MCKYIRFMYLIIYNKKDIVLKIIKILQSKTRMIYLHIKKTDIVRKLAQMLLTTFNCHDSKILNIIYCLMLK